MKMIMIYLCVYFKKISYKKFAESNIDTIFPSYNVTLTLKYISI